MNENGLQNFSTCLNFSQGESNSEFNTFKIQNNSQGSVNLNNMNIFQIKKSENMTDNLSNQFIPPRIGIMDTQKDWKKIMSDKLMRRMIQQRRWRVDSIRNNKDEILKELRYEEILNEQFDEDYLLSELFDKLVDLFEKEDVDSYQMEIYNNPHISVCPKCSYPVILTNKRILCLNLCFEYLISSGFINDSFTLDNFVDLISKVYSSHSGCLNQDQPQLLIFEDDIQVVCGSCLGSNIQNMIN